MESIVYLVKNGKDWNSQFVFDTFFEAALIHWVNSAEVKIEMYLNIIHRSFQSDK